MTWIHTHGKADIVMPGFCTTGSIDNMERKGFHPLDDIQRHEMNEHREAKARIDTEFREFREAHQWRFASHARTSRNGQGDVSKCGILLNSMESIKAQHRCAWRRKGEHEWRNTICYYPNNIFFDRCYDWMVDKMSQEDERQTPHGTKLITERITKNKAKIQALQEENDRLDRFVWQYKQ